MKKINTLNLALKQSMDVLTVSQMSLIRGGASTTIDALGSCINSSVADAASATADDKRRDRPGGGVSTH